MMGDTGLRPWKEGIHVGREDIGLSMGQFFVVVKESKTKHGERVVPISDRRVIDYLLETESGPLFPFKKEAVKTAWRRAADRAGIDADVGNIQ